MTKSGFVVGGLIGATAVILLFAFVFIPFQEIATPDLIISNGHGTIFGDETSSLTKKNLTLVELFEKSEESVVKIKVEST